MSVGKDISWIRIRIWRISCPCSKVTDLSCELCNGGIAVYILTRTHGDVAIELENEETSCGNGMKKGNEGDSWCWHLIIVPKR